MATTRACGGAAPLPNGAAVLCFWCYASGGRWAALRAPREGIWDRVGSGRRVRILASGFRRCALCCRRRRRELAVSRARRARAR
eukprot:5146498-Prymnesium_polylepis.1